MEEKFRHLGLNCQEFELEVKISPFEDFIKHFVNANWTLKDVRESLEFLDETNSDYRFKLDGTIVRKRVEKAISCMECLPPKNVTFEPFVLRRN